MKAKTKKTLKVLAIVLGALVLVYAVLALFPRGRNFALDNPMKKSGDMPILIAHGGGNKEFPDNTLEAFYNAYSVDENVMMETDVSITKDGVILLSHDTTIDRKTNATGEISEWNYIDLLSQKIDFNYHNPTDDDDRLSGERKKYVTGEGKEVKPTDVPGYPNGLDGRDKEVFLATTLEDLLLHFPENRINVEIKQSGELGKRAFAAVVELLEDYDAFDRVVLASFHDEIYAEFGAWQKAEKVPESFMYSPGTGGATKFFVLQLLNLDLFFGDKMCVFQLPTEQLGFDLATERLVNTAHKHNLAVHYWTINDEEEMRMLIEIGADGIMTDYPHRLKAVYDSYGK